MRPCGTPLAKRVVETSEKLESSFELLVIVRFVTTLENWFRSVMQTLRLFSLTFVSLMDLATCDLVLRT